MVKTTMKAEFAGFSLMLIGIGLVLILLGGFAGPDDQGIGETAMWLGQGCFTWAYRLFLLSLLIDIRDGLKRE